MVLVQQTSYCHIDDVNETVTELTHRVCPECGHVFETTLDMYNEIRHLAEQMEIVISPEPEYDYEAVTYCPLCLHDF